MSKIDRTQQLEAWLAATFPNEPYTLSALKGDASFRRYFRLSIQGERYIVMDAPPQTEPLQPFIQSTAILSSLKLGVPQIHHQAISEGFLVLDDFGHVDYQQALNAQTADALYKKAIDALITLQDYPDIHELPRFDAKQIQKELALFTDYFLEAHCQITDHSLSACFDYLSEACLKQPFVATHRDYHSRNLMVTPNHQPGILDHQDLMQGPITYDLVSLLKDCYIDWPKERIRGWVDYYLSQSGVSFTPFYHHFELTGVQRHLKAIGIFARQAHLYQNTSYLQYIPRAINYVKDIANHDPHLTELAKILARACPPLRYCSDHLESLGQAL